MATSRWRGFLDELRRRRVAGVAAGYAIAGWGGIEVSNTVLQMLAAPPWIGKLVLIAIAVGFPVALIGAWIFDWSNGALVRTNDVAATPPVLASARNRVVLIALAIVVVAFSAFGIWRRSAAWREVQFIQLTNFADAATAPALSPDGRTLVFLKGRGYFGNSAAASDVYIKQLPDGDAVQLTSTPEGKATPAFSPDGSRVAYTVARGNFHWETHSISTHGGHSSPLLPNASGLIWLDSAQVLYAELSDGIHMGIRRSTLERGAVRDVYWPGNNQGMAHRAAVSPDGKWVLIAEMEVGTWLPCRLVPLDGSSPGREVGPREGSCTYAAWAPNGRTMYFSSSAGGTFHLWRQRFPNGKPARITHGPTEEEGIAVAPDGRSLITSAGVRRNSIWLMGQDRDKQVTVEEFAFEPIASMDGKWIYYLNRHAVPGRTHSIGRLMRTAPETGAREELLPEHTMMHFHLTADDRQVVFVSGSTDPATQGIWVAPLDRHAPPRHVFAGQTDRAFFDAAANIYFIRSDGRARYLDRLRAPDYTTSERVYGGRVQYIFAISPDGEWIAAAAPREQGGGLQQVAISTRGLPLRVLCSFCGSGAGPSRLSAPAISWTRDGRLLLVSGQFAAQAGMAGTGATILIPVQPGAALPNLNAGGITAASSYADLPGARELRTTDVLPGATAHQLLYYESTTLRNLYRIMLPD